MGLTSGAWHQGIWTVADRVDIVKVGDAEDQFELWVDGARVPHVNVVAVYEDSGGQAAYEVTLTISADDIVLRHEGG